MCEIIEKSGKNPYAVVGAKSLQENEIFSLYGKKGIDLCCPVCGYPFILSMQQHGRVEDIVLCFNCDEKQAATIQESSVDEI